MPPFLGGDQGLQSVENFDSMYKPIELCDVIRREN